MAKRKTKGFQKGRQKTGGREKGVPNKSSGEVRAAALLIVNDDEYRTELMKAAKTRTLSPGMECLLWYYAYGKPTESVDLGGAVAVHEITPEMLKHMSTKEIETMRTLFRKAIHQGE